MEQIVEFMVGWLLGTALFYVVYSIISRIVERRRIKKWEEMIRDITPDAMYNSKGEKIWDPEIGICGPASYVECAE